MITARWRDDFICTPEIVEPGLRAAIYREAGKGQLVRVGRGVYLPTAKWTSLSPEGRHLARIRAVALTHPAAVFSHLSAALLWGLPIVGPPPSVPHVLATRASGGRSKTGIVRHCVGIPDATVAIDGVRTATLDRTVLDCVTSSPLEVALPIADAALHPAGIRGPDGLVMLDHERLIELCGGVPPSQGAARGRTTLELADGQSGSPGESLSRAALHRLGFPMPELQHQFFDSGGSIGFVDFWWPEFGLVGEFDGVGKYLREEFLGSRSPGEAVVAEKWREDRLRALGLRVVRWGWDLARSAPALRAHLIRAGLRPL